MNQKVSMKTLICLRPHGGLIGRIMIIDLIGIDHALPVHHIVVVDQAGISPVGRRNSIMMKMMVVGDSSRNLDLAINRQRFRLLMIPDRELLVSFGWKEDATEIASGRISIRE